MKKMNLPTIFTNMKSYISIIIAVFFCSGLFAQTTYNAEKKYDYPRSVIIVEGADGTSVEVIDNSGSVNKVNCRGEGDNYIRSSSRFNRVGTDCCGNWDIVSNGLCFGFVATPGSPSALSPDMGKSMEIGWLNIIAMERQLYRGWAMSLGIGIDWRNYRSTKGLVYESTGGHTEPGANDKPWYRFSRIKIFSLQFPLLWTKNFKKRSGMTPAIGFGTIFNLNTHGSVKTSWRDENGKKRNAVSNDIGQRIFTIDIYGQIRLGDVGVYVRYSPYKILTGQTPFDYRPLSVGVSLFY